MTDEEPKCVELVTGVNAGRGLLHYHSLAVLQNQFSSLKRAEDNQHHFISVTPSGVLKAKKARRDLDGIAGDLSSRKRWIVVHSSRVLYNAFL
jgi:hypothetical protein